MPSMHHNGGSWIRRDARLGIYLRDELTCVWCGLSVAGLHPYQVTLDHLTPRDRGGANAHANLATAHRRCNAERGLLSVAAYAATLPDPAAVLARIRRARRRAVPLERARAILAGLEVDPRPLVRQARAKGQILAPARSAAGRSWAARRAVGDEVPF